MTIKKKLIELPETTVKVLDKLAKKSDKRFLKPFIEKVLVDYAEKHKKQ